MFELSASTYILGLAVIFVIYGYLTRNHDYWKKRGVPFEKLAPFFSSIIRMSTKTLQDIEMERYKKHGLVHGYFEFNSPELSVSDPDLLRDILVKDFSNFNSRREFVSGNEILDKIIFFMNGREDWKRIRAIITPTFSTGKIKKVMRIFEDCSRTMIKNFQELSTKGQYIDVKKLFGAFTMDVIASSAFSTKIDSHNDPNNQFVRNAKKVFQPKFNLKLILFFMFPFLKNVLQIDVFPPDTLNFFKQITCEIMEERKRTGQTRNDFLQLLMDTAKEVAEDPNADLNEKGDITSNYGTQEDINPNILKSVTSKSLSISELVSQCVIFFIGGYDTTSSTMSFATYLLALNPDKQDRLREEVDRAIKECDGKLTYETIQNMKYLDNVISETLRIYPPFVRIERSAESDYNLGDTGITIPKGMPVTIPVFSIHRDSRNYPNPEKFDPERFTPEQRAKRHPYAYLPFGAGPRNCVAMRFALMEVKVSLAYIIANFRLKRCPETKVPLDFVVGQLILQPKGIILEMETRNDSPLLK